MNKGLVVCKLFTRGGVGGQNWVKFSPHCCWMTQESKEQKSIRIVLLSLFQYYRTKLVQTSTYICFCKIYLIIIPDKEKLGEQLLFLEEEQFFWELFHARHHGKTKWRNCKLTNQIAWAISTERRHLNTHKLNFHLMLWKFSQPYLLHNTKE